MASRNALGEFLRARRAQLDPRRLGIDDLGSRRVSGLRREEVASRAGISTDYYARLEQGREQHPSAAVLESLSDVLQLDPEARRYLHSVANPWLTTAERPGLDVSPVLATLISRWPDTPALVVDRLCNVLAGNALGCAVFGGHRYSHSLTRLVFLDEGARSFYLDWERVARSAVASLRAVEAGAPGDTVLVSLIEELSARSSGFRRLWKEGLVRRKTVDTLDLNHMVAGRLHLQCESLTINGSPDHQLKIYHHGDDPATARGLAVLAEAGQKGLREVVAPTQFATSVRDVRHRIDR
jgi:transcriptional regulator with XRE-family HTH domain